MNSFLAWQTLKQLRNNDSQCKIYHAIYSNQVYLISLQNSKSTKKLFPQSEQEQEQRQDQEMCANLKAPPPLWEGTNMRSESEFEYVCMSNAFLNCYKKMKSFVLLLRQDP